MKKKKKKHFCILIQNSYTIIIRYLNSAIIYQRIVYGKISHPIMYHGKEKRSLINKARILVIIEKCIPIII